MRRRNFLTGSMAAMTLGSSFGRAGAQDTASEARWDEASQMYGNAWHLLPDAEEGTIELTNVSYVPFMDSIYAYGVIHNNTSEPMFLFWELYDDAGTEYETYSPENLIAPGTRAIFNAVDYEGVGNHEDGEPILQPEFLTLPELRDVLGMNEEAFEIAIAENSVYPMQIDSLEYLGDKIHQITITNPTDREIDAERMRLYYSILFFDEQGTTKDGKIAIDMSAESSLPAGKSMSGELWWLFSLPLYSINPDTPYLLSIWAD